MYEIFEQLLSKYGVTAYKVAKETGITTATLSNWKQGKYTPKQDKLQKIADYFGSLREKLANKEFGPAAYDGQDIPEEDIDLFLGQVDLMLRRVKIKNKEKYNPNKNKKQVIWIE